MMDKNQICELAIEFFTESLAEQTSISPARRWLKENHEFLQDFLHPPFELAGYAPAEWDALVLFAAKHGVSGGDLVDAGLALERPNNPGGRYYDRFRNRIMISVRHKGVVVEFGGYSVTNALPRLLVAVPKHIREDPAFVMEALANSFSCPESFLRMVGEALARLIDQMVVEKKGES